MPNRKQSNKKKQMYRYRCDHSGVPNSVQTVGKSRHSSAHRCGTTFR